MKLRLSGIYSLRSLMVILVLAKDVLRTRLAAVRLFKPAYRLLKTDSVTKILG